MAAKKQRNEGPSRAAAALHTRVLTVPAARKSAGAVPASAAVVVGRLVAGSTPLIPVVEFPGNLAGPLRARITVSLDGPAVERAVVTGQGVTLVFENGDPRLPIVTGVLRSSQPVTPFQELLVAPPARPAAPAAVATAAGRPPLEARLDGERIVIEGRNEIVLRCGDASITLRRDGKMVLRGAYVETYAKGVNRIKGGSVKIN